MNILSWNYRELENPHTVHNQHLLVQEKRSNLVFLSETKLEVSRLKRVKRRLGFLGCVGVNPIGRKGGLALLWRNQNEVEILNFSQNHTSAWVYNASETVQ